MSGAAATLVQSELWGASTPAPAAPAVEAVRWVMWQIHHGGIEAGRMGGIWGQLTECRARGVIFYVRENVYIDHFTTSSNARIRLKQGQAPKDCEELELCAPAELWDELARAVAAADTMRRPVRPNRRFTAAWAEREFARRGAEVSL